MRTSDVTENVSSKMMTEKGKEGSFTKTIEEQTERIPSIAFLTLGIGAVAAALTLKAMGQDNTANFVGMWAPTILIIGIYNKLVKVEGSERRSLMH